MNQTWTILPVLVALIEKYQVANENKRQLTIKNESNRLGTWRHGTERKHYSSMLVLTTKHFSGFWLLAECNVVFISRLQVDQESGYMIK